MKEKIRKVVYGSTAMGKTRYCRDLCRKYEKSGHDVVTNIQGLINNSLLREVDKNKENIFNDYNIIKTTYSRIEKDMILSIKEYIVASGDVLILEDIDCLISSYDFHCIIDMLSEEGPMQDLWDIVVISGYSLEAMNLVEDTSVTPVVFITQNKDGEIMINEIKEPRGDIDDRYYETLMQQ